MKKIISAAVSSALIVSLLGGCGAVRHETAEDNGIIAISVNEYPVEAKADDRARFDSTIKEFEKKYPGIKVTGDTYEYRTDSFISKAASGQLPTFYRSWFTETNKIIDAGYAADLTDAMSQYGYDKAMNTQLKNLVTKNGKIYGIPVDAYCMGLQLNMNLFRQAGLVNSDGTAQFPKTYAELAQTASKIKEKTGQSGFALPTIGNTGGWYFMNIAWSFGVQFMKQENGKWISTFDSTECENALQYVRDLKWKYNVLPANNLIGVDDITKLYGTDQLAMTFTADNSFQTLIDSYSMSKDDISVVSMPKGDAGKCTLTGGGVSFVNSNANSRQIDACIKWSQFNGNSPEVTDEIKASWQKGLEIRRDKNYIIGCQGLNVWDSAERNAEYDAVLDPFINVNRKLFEDYNNKSQVEIRTEEPQYCQELYKTFDALLQEVLTNQSSDIKALIKKANSDFQVNYLDNAE